LKPRKARSTRKQAPNKAQEAMYVAGLVAIGVLLAIALIFMLRNL
jgi:hypothetical protein